MIRLKIYQVCVLHLFRPLSGFLPFQMVKDLQSFQAIPGNKMILRKGILQARNQIPPLWFKEKVDRLERKMDDLERLIIKHDAGRHP